MARFSPFVSTIFFFVLLLVAIEMGPTMVVEARKCESLSRLFKGLCLRNTNCGNVCHKEGFTGGYCGGALRKCHCIKPCGSKPLPSKPLPSDPLPSDPLPSDPLPSDPLPSKPVPLPPL